MNSDKVDVFKEIEKDIATSALPEEQKRKVLTNILKLKNRKMNILIAGATGSGKSSTINALFGAEKAMVGFSFAPMTMDICRYEFDNLILWDSPGLGDSEEHDIQHSRKIVQKLHEKDAAGKALIDLVLVILNGSNRDFGTSYALINEVIIPNLQDKNRILVAINQCDMAMKGYYWDKEQSLPEPKLVQFLEGQIATVRRRIKDGTGIDTEPIYYSAGYCDEEKEQIPYNLSKLLYYIIQKTPNEKRTIYINNINRDPNPWQSNDRDRDYDREIKRTLWQSVVDSTFEGAEMGQMVGSVVGSMFGEVGERVLGSTGAVIGGLIGGTAKAAGQAISSVGQGISRLFGW